MTTSADAAASTRKARAEQTRQRLLVAAIDQFARLSFDDVSVSDIAEQAGVAHGVLFHHFGSKKGIFLEAMRETARRLDASHTIGSDLSAGQRARAWLDAHFHFLAENRDLSLRLILGGRGSDPEAWAVFDELRWRTQRDWCELLGIESSNHAAKMMIRAAGTAVDDASARWLEDGEPYAIAAMIEASIELLAAGIRGAARLDPSVDINTAEALLGDRVHRGRRPRERGH
jgi:AcrR family transcriptional regulator